MLSYRNFLTLLSSHKIVLSIIATLLVATAIPTSIVFFSRQSDSNLSPVQYVNPFIGTQAGPPSHPYDSGNVFPGADFPHGMVQWSPDTTNSPGGYRYNQSVIHGFSLTHFSGRGCSSYQDFPFMPIVGSVSASPVSSTFYYSNYSHSREHAEPGYYSVHLDGPNVDVALSVTPRTGFGTFTYPSSKDATMLINAGGSATGDAASGTGIQVVGNNQVVGSASSGHFCGKGNTYTVYFAAQFEQPFTNFGVWQDSTVTNQARQSSGSHSGAYLTFDTTQNQTVQVKVGISYVSIASAQDNLQRENSQWDFSSIRSQASAAWNAKLSQIQVSGGTPAEKTIFYTALYHTLFHPNIFSDANGQYIGFDKQIHMASGYTQYENFPGWDMYRSLIGLRAILEPHEVSDMIRSLLMDAQQGGGALPRWEVANDNSAGMVGDSQDAVIATSYAFGVRNFDMQAALQAMNAGASDPNARSGQYSPREYLSDYLHLGYVPASDSGSASITLEYAVDDFAIAQFAKAAGNNALYQTYMGRSQNWKNVFNPHSGYIEPRDASGNFVANGNHGTENGFIEGTGGQYTWMVPQDLPTLFNAMSGNAVVVSRLDKHFSHLNAGMQSFYANMGNEPEFGVPWEYDFAGAPYRTQSVVRQIETLLFTTAPNGLPGNDDGGAMSSWYVFAAMGLYPEIPGVAGYAVGSPLFSSMTVHLGNGHTLQINGQNASPTSPYVQSLTLNSQNYNSAWIPFSSLENGATLQFTLGNSPKQNAINGPGTTEVYSHL